MSYEIKEPILQVKGLNHAYNGGKVILRDVNFQIDNIVRPGVNQGQVFSILGKSGSGKTTLASIIAGLLKPSSGHVLMGAQGTPVHPGEVGFVFQNYILFDHLTVLGNLMLSAYQGMFRKHVGKFAPMEVIQRLVGRITQRKALRETVDRYLDDFDLRRLLDQYPSELSGGQKQRLAILSQVLCSSRFIIFDEPFSGQDPEMKQSACELILKVSLLDEFQTLGIITHDIDCALWVSDKLLVMGREADPNGGFKPGNTVFKPYDLAEHGLAWQDESIRRSPQFIDLLNEIKYSWFPNL